MGVEWEETGYGYFQAGTGREFGVYAAAADSGVAEYCDCRGGGVCGAVWAVVCGARYTDRGGARGRGDQPGGEAAWASEIPVRTGWVVYSPLTTQIIEFP